MCDYFADDINILGESDEENAPVSLVPVGGFNAMERKVSKLVNMADETGTLLKKQTNTEKKATATSPSAPWAKAPDKALATKPGEINAAGSSVKKSFIQKVAEKLAAKHNSVSKSVSRSSTSDNPATIYQEPVNQAFASIKTNTATNGYQGKVEYQIRLLVKAAKAVRGLAPSANTADAKARLDEAAIAVERLSKDVAEVEKANRAVKNLISSAYLVSGHLTIPWPVILSKSLLLGSSNLNPILWLKVSGTLYLDSTGLPILTCLNLSPFIFSKLVYSLAASSYPERPSLILVRALLNSSKEIFPS